MDFQKIYLEQVIKAADGVTAFAVLQSLLFLGPAFSVDRLNTAIRSAPWCWAYITPSVAFLAYCGLIVGCGHYERLFLKNDPDLRSQAIYLTVGRVVAVMGSIAVVILIIAAVRHE